MRVTHTMAVVAAVALIAGCGGSSDADVDDSAAETTVAEEQPSATTSVGEPSTSDVDESSSATSVPDPPTTSTTTTMPAVFDADAEPIVDEFVPLAAGTYRVDTLGTPFTFTTTEEAFVQPNSGTRFVLTHEGSRGPDDRDIVALRFSRLADPADPTAPIDSRDDGWPADDIAGWFENVSDELVVTGVEDTVVGGLPTVRADIEVGEVDCVPSRFCVVFASNHRFRWKPFEPGSTYRVWIVDQGDEDPIVFVAGIARDTDTDWMDRATRIVSTVAFGDVVPNPVQAAPAGVAELPLFGGIRVELDGTEVVVDEAIGRIVPDSLDGDTEFLMNPLDADGEALPTAVDLVASMIDSAAVVDEVDPTVIGGLDARVFDIGGRPGTPLLTLYPGVNRGWFLPPRARMWVMDHPDRGVLMVTAEAFMEDIDATFAQVLERTEAILASLEFVELG